MAVAHVIHTDLGSNSGKPGLRAVIVLSGHDAATDRDRAENGVAPPDERSTGAREDGHRQDPIQLGEKARRSLLHLVSAARSWARLREEIISAAVQMLDDRA